MLTLRRAGVSDARVLAAFDQCVRADFLDPAYAGLAREDVAIPLPCGQISLKPSVLALMLEALQIAPQHRVLLVGAGSGYSAAILARLAAEVVALERFRTLRDAAAANLERAGLTNAIVELADGLAYTSGRSFDRILVAGAIGASPQGLPQGLPLGLPQGLMEALAPGGVLVAPLTGASGVRVAAIRLDEKGAPVQTDLFPVDVPPLEPGAAQRL